MNNILTPQKTVATVFDLPRFAPLSVPFLSHLIHVTISPDSLRDSKPVYEGLNALYPRFDVARNQVFRRLREASASQFVSMLWFREELALVMQRKQELQTPPQLIAKRYSITDPTISDWRQKNVLLSSPARGQSYTDNDAAILVAALVDSRFQGYLPSFVDPHEPFYWCYAQFPPTLMEDGTRKEPPVICLPYPLPPGLPAATLCWIPWPTFEPGWLQMESIGAIRFAGVNLGKRSWRWTAKRRDVALWEPDLNNRDTALFNSMSLLGNSLPHEMLESILRRLSLSRLL